jgi:hypothetical protein
MANTTATRAGSSAIRRKFLNTRSSPTATHAPTQALRDNVSPRATTIAGMTSAGQIRSREPNTRRPVAAQATSISTPE